MTRVIAPFTTYTFYNAILGLKTSTHMHGYQYRKKTQWRNK